MNVLALYMKSESSDTYLKVYKFKDKKDLFTQIAGTWWVDEPVADLAIDYIGEEGLQISVHDIRDFMEVGE